MTCIEIGGSGRRRGFICGDFGDESTYTKKRYNAPDCPNEDNHTPEPRGYGDWFSWAERMGRTHRQTRCPGCDLLTIWVPIVRRGTRKKQPA